MAVADFRLPSHLTEGFVTENRAQNKLEYQQAWYFYPLENYAIKIAREFWKTD